MNHVFIVLMLVLGSFAQAVAQPVELISPQRQSFSPAKGEHYALAIRVGDKDRVKRMSADIRTSDDDLIATLVPIQDKKASNMYTVVWDGKDSNGQIVPDEAYHPVINIEFEQSEDHVLDFRKTSGGEEVYDFEKQILPGIIEYTLPVDSRVIVRAGIKNGPMLRTVIDWEPRTKGLHLERWNGQDVDHLFSVEKQPNVGYLIMGYKLPDHSIVTYGNKKHTYREYRESKHLPIKQVSYENRLLDRNGVIIRPEYYQAVLQQKSPRIDVALVNRQTKERVSVVPPLGEVMVKVNIHEIDEIYLDQERYEISFFVDNEFISEEEQGFVPFTWRWSPGKHGIAPGSHVLTVNVSGYKGQVGVRNIPFTIIEE